MEKVDAVVLSRLQGAPNAEIMFVSGGKSQVLAVPIMVVAEIVKQGAIVLARASIELPIPPRKQCEPPATVIERNVMQEVSRFVRDYDHGGEIDSRTTRRREEYVDVANRTEAALDSVAWNRRVSPRLAVSKRASTRDA